MEVHKPKSFIEFNQLLLQRFFFSDLCSEKLRGKKQPEVDETGGFSVLLPQVCDIHQLSDESIKKFDMEPVIGANEIQQLQGTGHRWNHGDSERSHSGR